MSNAFSGISEGLINAINHAKGKPTKVTHKIENTEVKKIRKKLGMRQRNRIKP